MAEIVLCPMEKVSQRAGNYFVGIRTKDVSVFG